MFEGQSTSQDTNKVNIFEKQDLSSLVDLLAVSNDQSQPNQKNVAQLNLNKLVEMQDMIQMYEGLQLKNEYCTLLKHYCIMIFQAGDFSKIRQLFVKYGMLEV